MATHPFSEVENDLILHRIGVLKLIDQDGPIGLFDPRADGGMVAQQYFSPSQKPVECDPPGVVKAMTNVIEKRSYERHHLLKIHLVNSEEILGQSNNGGCFLERSFFPSSWGLSQIFVQNKPFILSDLIEPREPLLQQQRQ